MLADVCTSCVVVAQVTRYHALVCSSGSGVPGMGPQASNYTTASTAIAVVPFPFAVVPSYFLPHRRHSSAVMPFSLAVVCPSTVISHPRIIPDLDPLVITNTTNLFRSIDKISSNCKCLGAPPWRSKFAVVPFQTC